MAMMVLESKSVFINISFKYMLLSSAKFLNRERKVQVGNDQEMAQSERNSHSNNRGVGKN